RFRQLFMKERRSIGRRFSLLVAVPAVGHRFVAPFVALIACGHFFVIPLNLGKSPFSFDALAIYCAKVTAFKMTRGHTHALRADVCSERGSEQ
ncbi:MAG TPA: hypothetical protein K8U77_05565, partial [Slackia equolifaciens]|nr:hypothetical protein [Slackia equolifaciens]